MVRPLVLAALGLAGCAAGGDAAVGVPACDDYLARTGACVVRLGPATVEGTQLAGRARMQAKIWAGSDRASLATLCEQALAQAKREIPRCAW